MATLRRHHLTPPGSASNGKNRARAIAIPIARSGAPSAAASRARVPVLTGAPSRAGIARLSRDHSRSAAVVLVRPDRLTWRICPASYARFHQDQARNAVLTARVPRPTRERAWRTRGHPQAVGWTATCDRDPPGWPAGSGPISQGGDAGSESRWRCPCTQAQVGAHSRSVARFPHRSPARRRAQHALNRGCADPVQGGHRGPGSSLTVSGRGPGSWATLAPVSG